MTIQIFPVLFIVTAFLVCFGSACTYTSDADKRSDEATVTNQNQSNVAGEIRRSVFDISSLDGQLNVAGEDSTLIVHLFDDIEVHARLIAFTDMMPGVVSYRYEITEPEQGILIISVKGSNIAAHIDLPGSNRKFLIQPVYESNDHIVVELDPSQLDILEGGQPVTPDN